MPALHSATRFTVRRSAHWASDSASARGSRSRRAAQASASSSARAASRRRARWWSGCTQRTVPAASASICHNGSSRTWCASSWASTARCWRRSSASVTQGGRTISPLGKATGPAKFGVTESCGTRMRCAAQIRSSSWRIEGAASARPASSCRARRARAPSRRASRQAPNSQSSAKLRGPAAAAARGCAAGESPTAADADAFEIAASATDAGSAGSLTSVRSTSLLGGFAGCSSPKANIDAIGARPARPALWRLAVTSAPTMAARQSCSRRAGERRSCRRSTTQARP